MTGLCPHNYTSQPPEDIVCNPYPNHMLKIQCGVTGSNLHRIQWYFSASNDVNIYGEDVLEITNSSKYTLLKKSNERELTIILTVNDLNEENDTGSYWCRAFLLDGTMLISPNSFELKTSNMYFLPCRADVIVKSSISVCAQQITSTSATTLVTSPSPHPTASPGFEMTDRATELFITTDYLQQTTFPSALSHLPTLYVVVGPVGFLILVCALLALVVCFLCKKIRNKGK